MRGSKAKAIRRSCQERNGATKSKQYFKQERNRPVFDKDNQIVGQIFIFRIIADEPRRAYKKEKKEYKALPKKQRKGRYV